jgi:hypothetical protein
MILDANGRRLRRVIGFFPEYRIESERAGEELEVLAADAIADTQIEMESEETDDESEETDDDEAANTRAARSKAPQARLYSAG